MTPIRKGANPVKIPFPIKTTDRVLAAWCNEVRTALQQIEARQPTANVGRGASAGGGRPPFFGTVSRVPDSDPAEYQVTFTLGYLTYQNAGANESDQGVTGYLVPTIEGVPMDDEAVEPLPLPGLVSFVYLRVKTDADGIPKFDGESVTIEAFEEAQESIHHVRPSPSGGEEEGDYFFLLLETESNEATPTPAPRVVRRLTGNREMPNQLVEITNIGGKRELYEGYLPGPDDKHQFRTLEQLEGDGEPVIKDLDPGDPEADPPVAPEEEGPTIKFRRVAERATNPQIQVKDGGDVIRVEGNGYDDTYIDPFGGQVAVADGLVTGIQGGAFSGWWGTIEWVYEAAGGSEETYLHLRQTFRNGILTKVEYWSGVAPVDAPGTEGSPAIVVFNIIDS